MSKNTGNITRNNGRKTFIFICALYSCFFSIDFSFAEAGGKLGDNEVQAIGTGSIAGGNLAWAKKSAISEALMKGLEDYLLARLGTQGVANNFQRLVQEIIPRAEEAIENFHILAEDRVGEEYKVFLRLRINEKVIDEKLRQAGLIFTEGPPTKVLFLVLERNKGMVSYWWKDPEAHAALSLTELALHNEFQKMGFSPINRTLSVPEVGYSKDLRSPDLRDADVLRWGELYSADVVFYGQTEFSDEKEVSLALKAFDVKQGLQICEGMQVERIENRLEGKGRVIETLDRLVNHLATRLAPTVMAGSGRETINEFEITLQGLSTYTQFRIFKDFLRREVMGVKSVRQTRVKKRSISMAVEFQGDRDRFLSRVLNNENVPFALGVDQVEGGKIVLKIE